MSETPPKKRRSQAWFGGSSKDHFIHRSWMKSEGLPDDSFDGRPVIGICNTWSELTPCNQHFRQLADKVRHGVLQAGGLPLEFPVSSLGETLMRPTAMLYRNLASIDVEEALRAHPLDGVVLLAGCDKTTPATLMGAASVDLPTIVVSGGAMLNGRYRGETIGSGTHVWKFAAAVAAGTMSHVEFMQAESCMSRSAGVCMTMGTASTMACLAEALGVALPDNAAIPAVDSRRSELAQRAGRQIVEMVRREVRLSHILTRHAFENAIRVCGAIGGSTNAVIHLLAIAGRVGVPLSLEDWDRLGRDIPTIVDLMPSGRFLMEDFYYAGGLPAVMRRLLEAGLLHADAVSVNGLTLAQNVAQAECFDDEVIRPLDKPLVAQGGLAVLRGNLAPDGAVIKPSAATPALLRHTGRAVVFESIEDYKQRIDAPDLAVEPSSILVLKNCGPKGYPGMAEVGNMGLPPKLLRAGVTDMVRISDARMSGTAYGTVILHVAPEAAAGGPLALVQEGDMIELDVERRHLQLLVDAAELERRRAAWSAPAIPASGYARLYVQHVQQANLGADLDFLVGCRGDAVPRESH
ncbi:MAG: dihydroxy-acid dehydratase [Betaproteobacteria bacterium]|nr:dihydroxy-acid dehydratase [Betaproteobacteria bacterium]MDE2124218.1 dihydroxy-acid dehydratase [Betaproteobacteria bacterium]MDE2187803.1 dihydroxy-acid dehydratase [Betaproteobacteria bacterium]MDE2323258.1 dihydroxy-acid dehydratase [Betaproteobacteria bacterium]